MSAVVLAKVNEELCVAAGDEIDGNAFAAEASRSTDAVDVFGSVRGEIVIDDKVDLLDVNATAHEIGGDQDA